MHKIKIYKSTKVVLVFTFPLAHLHLSYLSYFNFVYFITSTGIYSIEFKIKFKLFNYNLNFVRVRVRGSVRALHFEHADVLVTHRIHRAVD